MCPPERNRPDAFPTTDWTTLDGAKDADPVRQRQAAVYLAERYWRPVFSYLRSFGHDPLRAEDLTQEFFARFFANGALAKADMSRGRFRNFLLGSLTNFLRNERRDSRAAKRIPAELIDSIHNAIQSEGDGWTPRDNETPEAAFHRSWTIGLLLRVLAVLEAEFRAGGRQEHYEIFRRFLVEPALQGGPPPSYAELASAYGMSEVQIGARITTARRAYQRLLREEIRAFAGSDQEIDAEIDALFVFLAKP